MPSLRALLVLGALVLTAVAGQDAQAAEPENTVITVREMCGGCVKKITARLEKVSGIESINCDIAKKSVSVTIGQGGPSPRALWSAMEEIGKTPVQMVGPLGTFTEKPKE